ncbi:UNVERIFIED_CONTAM: hypothetical protein HHA_449620 [Hammondia hammondi]|eukprot:XP_008882274.1 hypothetical protein HHA_449620 [Hammondia hammondi]
MTRKKLEQKKENRRGEKIVVSPLEMFKSLNAAFGGKNREKPKSTTYREDEYYRSRKGGRGV